MSNTLRLFNLGFILAAWLVLLVGGTVRAAENRFWLASQQDFGGKRGFYLAFENTSQGDQPARLNTLRLILGVGDGASWRFPTVTPAWKLHHEYTVTAVIGARSSRLRLDDLPALDSPGAFGPATESLLSNYVPEWAAGAADYAIVQTSLQLETSRRRRISRAFPGPAQVPEALRLFGRQPPPHREDLALAAGETLTIRATFQLDPAPGGAGAARRFAPLIDRYGQAIAAPLPGKVRTDADLKAPIAEEARRFRQWGATPGRDRFGGDARAGWHEAATGFYRTVKRRGFWWLVSPDGNPCFYTGLCTAPALTWETTPVTGREALFADLPPRAAPYGAAWGGNPWGGQAGAKDWVALRTANLIRKYGPDWKARATTSATQRLGAWGFSGLGKWCDLAPAMPSVPVLSTGGVPKLARHADVFDPAVRTQLRETLRKQIAAHQADPFVVGWSVGNEYDEIITADEITQILKLGADIPAKRALIDEALRGHDLSKLTAAWKGAADGPGGLYAAPITGTPPADLERLRRFYADRYYALFYKTVKEIDPHHLYLGFWIVPNWWVNEEDWRLIARHCDVIGYDHYGFEFADPALRRLMREANKPVLCGEFSFPPDYGGARGFGVYSVWADDEAQAGGLYAGWVRDAAQNPYCVGVCWFQYRDEPLTGRGPGGGPEPVYGEHYAFGLVDESDRPKWPLIERVRRANLATVAQRLRAAAEPGGRAPSRSAPRRTPAAAPRPPSGAAR